MASEQNNVDNVACLFRESQTDLLSYARRRVPLGVDPSDVVAEAFARALARPYRAVTRAWLFCAVKNILLEEHRRARASRRAHREKAVLMKLQETEHVPEVDEAVARLSHTDQAVLGLVYVRGLTHAEGANEMGLSVSAFSKRLLRARARLRDMLLTGSTVFAVAVQGLFPEVVDLEFFAQANFAYRSPRPGPA
ncbi:RNA polymerase sigma factor [Arthrobacter ramosus]|uniref:RNA polymerase sigma factor n=1 Tax=Arthrobacter ramosus TaxID=1672 RepID=UPI0031E358FA